jgi:glycosyltransferase involved in cell wall biosynthesis
LGLFSHKTSTKLIEVSLIVCAEYFIIIYKAVKLSLITVSYNSELTIRDTLESVKNQSNRDLEYIVIDGGSTDGTIEILKDYSDIIDKIVSEPDKGIYDAMNKGIEIATGDIVGILNSDDTFYSNTVINEVISFHKKNKIQASIGNISQYTKSGKLIRLYCSNSWVVKDLKFGFMPAHPSIFFEKELFNIFGNYSLDYKIAADYELIVRFFLKQKIIWKYSNIHTTKMLIGGASSNGIVSYLNITREIIKALNDNGVRFFKVTILFRLISKLNQVLFKE